TPHRDSPGVSRPRRHAPQAAGSGPRERSHLDPLPYSHSRQARINRGILASVKWGKPSPFLACRRRQKTGDKNRSPVPPPRHFRLTKASIGVGQAEPTTENHSLIK